MLTLAVSRKKERNKPKFMLQFCEILLKKAENLTAAHSVYTAQKLNSLFDMFFIFHWDFATFVCSSYTRLCCVAYLFSFDTFCRLCKDISLKRLQKFSARYINVRLGLQRRITGNPAGIRIAYFHNKSSYYYSYIKFLISFLL